MNECSHDWQTVEVVVGLYMHEPDVRVMKCEKCGATDRSVWSPIR